ILDTLRTAGASLDPSKPEALVATLMDAWKLDPGNYEVARWLSHSQRPDSAAENRKLAAEGEAQGGSLPETLMAASRVLDIGPQGSAPLDALQRSCKAADTSGCAVELALKLGHSQRNEEASQVLAPVAEKEGDADVWRTLGDLYFALENTYRAKQAYDK